MGYNFLFNKMTGILEIIPKLKFVYNADVYQFYFTLPLDYVAKENFLGSIHRPLYTLLCDQFHLLDSKHFHT